MEGDFVGGSHKVFRCQKASRDLPLDEPRCANPKSYCKWRTACPVHMLEREKKRLLP